MTTRKSNAARRLSDAEREASERADNTPQIPYLGQGFYESWDDFLNTDLPPNADLLTGLERREVALLFTGSALVQSNFLLQLALALASGQTFPSLLPAPSTPRRVLYINTNWRAARWQQQLDPLLQQLPEPQLAKTNFLPSVESWYAGSPLRLDSDAHLKHLMLTLKHLRPEVIILDDLEALFPSFADEPTAQAARLLMTQLENLAASGDCVLLAATSSPYLNRRFVATEHRLADAVFRLENPRCAAFPAYRLHCEKSRGVLAKSLWLDWQEAEHRFVERQEASAASAKELPTLAEIAAFVEAQQGARTGEIIKHFVGQAGTRKMAYLLNEAEVKGWLRRVRPGYWMAEKTSLESLKSLESPESPESLESVESVDSWESFEGFGSLAVGKAESDAGQEAESGADGDAAGSADHRAEPRAVVRAVGGAEFGAESRAESGAVGQPFYDTTVKDVQTYGVGL